MRKALVLIALVAGVGVAFGPAIAQQYVTQTTSVTSATTPVNVLSGAARKTWCITPRTGAAVPVDCFAYEGPTVPTAVPSPAAIQEITAGKSFCDQLTGIGSDVAVNEAWACVLSTGVTAVTVDATYR